MTEDPTVPEWDKLDIPEEDAEPEDATVEHLATEDEVEDGS